VRSDNRSGGFLASLFAHSFRIDAHLLLLTDYPLESDVTVRGRKKRVVFADADVLARMDPRAALANNNVARGHILAAIFLDAQALRITVSVVAAGAAAFFVCHFGFSPITDSPTGFRDASDIGDGLGGRGYVSLAGNGTPGLCRPDVAP